MSFVITGSALRRQVTVWGFLVLDFKKVCVFL
jgi:hypothetical protein